MSLFNRPTWAKSQTTADTDEPDANIFSHSGRSYREIVAEQERKKQAKIEKKKAKEERRNSEKHDINTDNDGGISYKRRRISVEDDEVDSNRLHVTSVPNVSIDERDHTAQGSEKAQKRRSHRKNKHVDTADAYQELRHAETAEVVEQGNSDADEDTVVAAVLPSLDVTEEESDDEFAELARRAREQRLQNEQQSKTSHTSNVVIPSLSPGPDTLDTGQDSLPTPPPDPPIQLFITSRIPDTNEMIVYRKLSQNIADVRKVWCKRQGFSEEKTKDVFFVHRMRRVYDVTTCRSLGLEVDSFGKVTIKGAEGKDDIEKVHLEAVTDEIFTQMKKNEALESQRRSKDHPTDAGTNKYQTSIEQAKEEPSIRLLLKANKRADFRLKVKPTTLISRIVAAYTKTQLTDGESAYLALDGERLNPNDEVQNTDISDMDCIEVHIFS